MSKLKKQDKFSETHIPKEISISSQNKDTGLPSYNPDDTRPFEQKNTSAGFHKSGMGSK